MRSREVEKKICEHTNKNSDCSQKMETTANGAQKALNQAPHKDLLTDPFSVEHMMRDNAKEYARSRLESLSKEAYLESLSIQADWRNRVGAREAVQGRDCSGPQDHVQARGQEARAERLQQLHRV